MLSTLRRISRRLSVAELSTLATEVREEVISIVSEVGGHFASTLGAVELTLALHYVFDTPEDRIVWDTGHQAYAHKLICGRRTRLATIRQLDGLSGFLSREESEVRCLWRRPCGHFHFRGARYGGSQFT